MSVSFYDYIPFHRNIHGRILYAQTADHYTDEEIADLFSLCRSVYERDYLVDRLYLASQHNRRGKKKRRILLLQRAADVSRSLLSTSYIDTGTAHRLTFLSSQQRIFDMRCFFYVLYKM